MTIGSRTVVAAILASAAAFVSTGAQALNTVDQSSSDLVLFVQDVESNGTVRGTYGLDTGISISQLLPSSDLSSGAKLVKPAGTLSDIIPESGTLSTFLGGVQGGDTVLWTVEGGYYGQPGASVNVNNVATPGAAEAVFSSVIGTTNTAKIGNLTPTNEVQLLNQYNSTAGSVSALAGTLASVSATATETTNGTWSATDQAKAGILGNGTTLDVNSPGTTALDLFGITGNGATTGKVQSYILGTVTFNNGVLTIAGNPTSPVPLPAAVWLLGSGLMGLFGVSRRRLATAA